MNTLGELREHAEWVETLAASDMDGISAVNLNVKLISALDLADALVAERDRYKEALRDAADRIEADALQIHGEWGVGPYEPDPFIAELRALAGEET